MSKIKVSELAKELDKSSRDIIVALKKGCRVFVDGQNSVITEEQAEKVKAYLKKQEEEKKNAGAGQAVPSVAVMENKTAASAQQTRHLGGLDSRGNYVADAPQDQGPARPARKTVKAAETKQTEKQPAEKAKEQPETKPAAKAEAKPAPQPEAKPVPQPEEKPAVKAEAKPSVKPEDKPASVEKKTASTAVRTGGDHAPRREQGGQKPRRDGAAPARDGKRRDDGARGPRQGQDRDGRSRDGGRDRDGQGARRGAPGQNRSGQTGRVNIGAALGKDAPQTKDTRDRKGHNKDNKNRDARRNERDYEDRENKKGGKNAKSAARNAQHAKKPAPAQKVVEKITSIELPESITLQELAEKMKIPVAQVVKKMFMKGKVYTQNTPLTYDEAEEIAFEYDILCEKEKVVDVIEEMLREEEENEADMVPRAPVVCVMGHVDHGKTSILDAIRNTHVTQGEAGGITQHIGAYVVDVNGQKITFLDTPGHEAFTAMRLRGAQSTDIAILVVAADDGVMPQTIEAISHAKAAGIEIIVAINKIDKPGANVDRVKQELTEYELVSEDWGGKTIMVPVSAKTGQGLDNLLDMILLVAEMLELKANPNRLGRGLILEAKLDKGRGPVATVLVQKGTVSVGSNISVGTAFGRIKAMVDDKGKHVKKAGPSTPVEITGLNEVPQAGEVFVETSTEKEARAMAEKFIVKNREQMLAATTQRLSLDSLFDQIREGQIKELNIVLKADVQGSVEAMKQSLVKLSNDEVAVKVIHGGVGAINESDVTLATASNAIIIGFNVKPDNHAKNIAEQENVDIRLYTVIYKAIEDIEAAMKGMLEPEFREVVTGHAEVRQTYRVSGIGTVIGAYVQDGRFVRSTKVRLLRDNVIIYEGSLASLKRYKDDVKEVNTGYECGMTLEKYNDIKEGDIVEAYAMEEVPR